MGESPQSPDSNYSNSPRSFNDSMTSYQESTNVIKQSCLHQEEARQEEGVEKESQPSTSELSIGQQILPIEPKAEESDVVIPSRPQQASKNVGHTDNNIWLRLPIKKLVARRVSYASSISSLDDRAISPVNQEETSLFKKVKLLGTNSDLGVHRS